MLDLLNSSVLDHRYLKTIVTNHRLFELARDTNGKIFVSGVKVTHQVLAESPELFQLAQLNRNTLRAASQGRLFTRVLQREMEKTTVTRSILRTFHALITSFFLAPCCSSGGEWLAENPFDRWSAAETTPARWMATRSELRWGPAAPSLRAIQDRPLEVRRKEFVSS